MTDGDTVGVVRGVEAVHDRHDGASSEHRGQCPFGMTCRCRVEHGGRLVEHHGVRVLQHDSGQRELLGLCRRRVPGPRREEVAVLAGVSPQKPGAIRATLP